MSFSKINNEFGIYNASYNNLISSFSKFETIEKVLIFGSRAMGNFKKGSDIDIAIIGKKITQIQVTRLSAFLNEELPIPYFIDVIHFESIKNQELKNHILEKGKIIYQFEKIII